MSMKESDILDSILKTKEKQKNVPNPYLKYVPSVQDLSPKYDPLALKKSTYDYDLGIDTNLLPSPDFGFLTGTGKDKDKKPKGENPFFTILNGLQGLLGGVTNQLYYWTDKKFDFKDVGGAQVDAFKVGFKSQGDAWKDGVFDWNDIPGLGVLAGMGKSYKIGKDILVDNLGAAKWKDMKYSDLRNPDKPWYSLENLGAMAKATDWVDIAGLGIDIATDPSTLLTGGALSAAKAGARAGRIAATSVVDDLAKQGLEVVGKIDKKLAPNEAAAKVVRDSVENKLQKDFAQQAGKSFDEYSKDMDTLRQQFDDPNIRPAGFDETQAKSLLDSFDETFAGIKREADLRAQEAFNLVDNKMREARFAMQDKVFSIDIPFTDYAKGFGKRPKFLTRLDRTIDEVGEQSVRNTFRFLGVKDMAQMDDIIKRLYNVDSIGQMTTQASKHFQKNIEKFNQKISNSVIKVLYNAKASESVVAEVTRVLNKYSFTNQLGDNIAKVMAQVDPANIRLSARQNDAVIKDQIDNTIKEITGYNLKNFIAGQGTPSYQIPDLDEATLRAMMMNGLDPNNINIMQAHQNLLKGLREHLTANNAPLEAFDFLKSLQTKFQEQLKTQQADTLKNLEDVFKQVAEVVDTEVSAFRGALLGTTDPNNPIQKQLEDLAEKQRLEEQALIAQRTAEEKALNDKIKELEDLKQAILNNKSDFATVTQFGLDADELYETLIKNQKNPNYAEYNQQIAGLLKKEFNFKEIELEFGTAANAEELMYNGIYGAVQQLKMLSQFGFAPKKFDDLVIRFVGDVSTPSGSRASYVTNPIHSVHPDKNVVGQIVVSSNGKFSFTHELMHYLEDKMYRPFHDKYLSSEQYQQNRFAKDYPYVMFGKGTVFEPSTKSFVQTSHPFYDVAQFLENANVGIKGQGQYAQSHTEMLARFFDQAILKKFKSAEELEGLKINPEFKNYIDRYYTDRFNDPNNTTYSFDTYTSTEYKDGLKQILDVIKGLKMVKSTKTLKKAEDKLLTNKITDINKKVADLDQKYDPEFEKIRKQYEPEIQKQQDLLEKFKKDTESFGREFVTANRFQQDITLRRLTRSKYINPHSLSSKSNFVEGFGKIISEAETMTYGEKVRMQGILRDIDKSTKQFTQNELGVIPYLLQNAFPRGMTKDQFLKSRGVTQVKKVEDVTQKMKEVYEKLGTLEQEVGAIVRLGENYFPHVYTKPDAEALAELQKLATDFPDDPLVKELMGRSQKLGFDKTRRSFQTLADLDDYMDKVDEQIANAVTPEEVAKLQSKKIRLQSLIERNPINALAIRMSRSIRARVNKQMYDTFQKNSLLIKKENLSNVSYDPKLMKTLTKEEAAFLGLSAGDVINKEIFEGLKKIDGLLKDDKLDRFLQQVDSINSIWKQLITSLVPKYYFYNMIGNLFNNALAGVSMSSYRESAQLMKRIYTKKLTSADKKFLDQAIADGVVNQGFLTDMGRYFKNLEEPGRFQPTYGQRFQEFIGEKTKNIPVIGTEKLSYKRNLERVGEFTDDFTRLANYIDSYKKTGSRELARASVAKYLFNYRELSRGDRYIRQLLPFWTWTRNNIPLQLEKLFLEPRFALTWLKIKREMQGELEDEDVPEWILESSFFIGDKAIDPRLPITDLNQVFKRTPPEFFAEWMGMMNPVVKNVIELSMNKKFFNQRPINYGETPAQDYTAYGLQQLGQFGSTTANLLFKDEPNVAEEIQKIFLPVPREIPGR